MKASFAEYRDTFYKFLYASTMAAVVAAEAHKLHDRDNLYFPLFGDFRGILSRAEIEFAEEEKDSGSEVVEGTEAARIGLDGLDA